jgi:catechol 2,3-dioxygenase-like lactoylglutathione lyase family enzyme
VNVRVAIVIRRLDHVNIRTANLSGLVRFYTDVVGLHEGQVRFYTDVVGLHEGQRPPLGFAGAWMYAGSEPVIHLVATPQQPAPEGALRLEHFAFSADGLDEFVARLESAQVSYRRSRQAGTGTVVINLHDPDGNRLHVDFAASEAS